MGGLWYVFPLYRLLSRRYHLLIVSNTVVDKIQSLYQGRPVSLQELECSVSIQFMDHYEELEHWKPFAYSETQKYPGSPAYSVSTLTQLCKLSLIMNRILNKVYGERNSKRTPLCSWHSQPYALSISYSYTLGAHTLGLNSIPILCYTNFMP